ncbi:hypothetical protein [Suttonella ornithocola]|uniref:hypothetical protein n=1 Tax=Suttonella ornithocola TaxID=279832 RepID=UPI0011C07DE8|nr:hypothetical protein [Suttonella ornithocola]
MAIEAITSKIGCNSETLRAWDNKHAALATPEGVQAQDTLERIKILERENRELQRSNEILRKAAAFFRTGGALPPTQTMIDFIEQYQPCYGVEAICTVLPIAPPSTYSITGIKIR